MKRPKVSELKGFNSLRAYNAFHTLMMGLKMLPAYIHEEYEAFFARIEVMSPEDQEKMILQAVRFVPLEKIDTDAMASFCSDPNGVPYTTASLAKIPMSDLIAIVVAVAVEISKIQINFVSEAEKKN